MWSLTRLTQKWLQDHWPSPNACVFFWRAPIHMIHVWKNIPIIIWNNNLQPGIHLPCCRRVDDKDNVTMAPFLFVPGKLEDLEIMLISFISQLKFSLWRGINLSSFLYIDIIFVILNIRFVPKNQTKKSLEKSGGGGLLMGILEGVKVSCYPLPWLFPEDAVCWSASIRSFWTWAIIAVLT